MTLGQFTSPVKRILRGSAWLVRQVLAEMEDEDRDPDDAGEVSSTVKPSPSALMLAAGLATAQNTLRDRDLSNTSADEMHCAPSTELQAGYTPARLFLCLPLRVYRKRQRQHIHANSRWGHSEEHPRNSDFSNISADNMHCTVRQHMIWPALGETGLQGYLLRPV